MTYSHWCSDRKQKVPKSTNFNDFFHMPSSSPGSQFWLSISFAHFLTHCRRKTYVFHKSFSPQTLFLHQNWLHGRVLLPVLLSCIRFCFSFTLFFVFRFRAVDKAGYPAAFRRALIHSIRSYRIVSLWLTLTWAVIRITRFRKFDVSPDIGLYQNRCSWAGLFDSRLYLRTPASDHRYFTVI